MKKTYIITKVVKKKHDSSRPDLRSFKSCMIKECPNSTLDNSKTFIPFPNCQDAFERWSPFIKTPNLGIYSKIFICSDHFKVEVRKCVMSMLKEIKEGALPIISGSIIDPDPWVKIDSVRSCNPAEIDEPGKSSLHDDVDMTIVKQEQDVQETAIDPPDQQPESSLLNEKDDGVKSSTEASVSQPVGFRLKVKDLRSLQESPQKVLDSTDSTSFNEEPGVEKVLKKRRRCAGKIVINQASEPVCVSKNVTRLRNVNHVKKKKRKKVLWVYKDDMDELGYDDIPTKRGKTRKRNRRKKKQVSNEVNMRKIETMASERYADNITSYMRKNIHGVVPRRTEDKIFSWLSTGRRGKRRLKKPTRPVCKPKTSVIEQLCKNENHTSSHDVILDEACNDELEGSEELINYEKSINLIPSGSVLTSTEDSDMHQVILVEKDGQWNFFDENKDEFNTFYDDTEDEHNYAIRSNVRPSETNTSLDNECSETDTDKEPEDQIGTECPVDLNSSNKDDSQVGSKCQSFDEHNYFKTWQNKGTKMKFCSTCNSILRHNKCYKWFKHLSCSQFSFECSNCTLRTDSADFLVTHMIVHHGLEVFNMRVVTKMKNGKKYVHRGINEVVEGADPKFAVKKHNVNLAFLMDKLRYGATISRECTGDRNIAGHLYHLKNMLFVLSEYSIRRIAFEYISRYHPFEIVKCVDSVRMVDIVWYRNFIRKYPAVLEGNAPMFSSLKHETDVFFDRFIELCRKLSLSRNSVYTVDFTTVFVSDELPTVSTGRQRSVQTNVEKVSLLCGVRGDGAFTTTLITSSFPLSSDSSEVVIDSGPTDGKIDSGSFAMFIHSFLRKVKPMERVLLLVDGSKYYTQSFEIYENLMAKGVTILSIPGNLLSLNPLRNCIFPAIVSRMQAVINKRIKKFGKANVSDFVSVFEEACKTNGQEKDLSSLVVQAYAAFGIIPFNKQGTLNKLMSKRSKSDRGYLLNFRPIKEKISDLVLNCIVPINSPPEGLKRKRTNTRRFNILKRQSKVVKKSLQKKLENPVGKGVRRDVQKDARTDRRKNNKSAPVSKQTNTTVIDEPCQEDLLEDAPKVKEEISDDVVGELMDIIVKEDSKQPKAGRRSVDPRKGKKKCLICKKMHATESKMFVCDSCRV